MNVVVLINGCEAIPVRALPLVAPVPYGVRYLVEGLMCCHRDARPGGLPMVARGQPTGGGSASAVAASTDPTAGSGGIH